MTRVQLIAGQQNIRNALQTEKLVKTGRNLLPIWNTFNGSDGHGRTGQVRESVWYGRSIILLDRKLNRGSAIDFINALVDRINDQVLGVPLKKLDKGGVFSGGSSDKDIIKLFEDICLQVNKKPDLLANLGKKEGVVSCDPFQSLGDYRP